MISHFFFFSKKYQYICHTTVFQDRNFKVRLTDNFINFWTTWSCTLIWKIYFVYKGRTKSKYTTPSFITLLLRSLAITMLYPYYTFLGSIFEPCCIQNGVIMNRVINGCSVFYRGISLDVNFRQGGLSCRYRHSSWRTQYKNHTLTFTTLWAKVDNILTIFFLIFPRFKCFMKIVSNGENLNKFDFFLSFFFFFFVWKQNNFIFYRSVKNLFQNPIIMSFSSSFTLLISHFKCTQLNRCGWLGETKASCILRNWGIQLILAYSWARSAIL